MIFYKRNAAINNTSNMNKTFALLYAILLFPLSDFSQSFTEGFDNIETLNDWYIQNNSVSPGTSWQAGNPAFFAAESGNPSSYFASDHNCSSSNSLTTLSNWLFTPTRTFNNGDIISFYTRTKNDFPIFPDRLEVRMSTAGNSIYVGSSNTSVGSFTNLLLTINPTLTTTDYPTTWTQYTITISGLNGPTNGRIAFRYYVTNGGPNGTNSNYIGIDSYTYSSIISPPTNDDCFGATVLNQTATCNLTNGSVAYASESLPACTGNANDDVWYKFVATTTGAAITVNSSYEFDPVLQLYSGNCAVLNPINCINNNASGESELASINTLNVGQTYYLRIHDFNDYVPNSMTFSICVQQFSQCDIVQPYGSQLEDETCGTETNGGCYSSTPIYRTITCGQTYFGTAWAENDNRDTDWYKFNLQEPGLVTFSGQAEFPYTLILVDISNCNTPYILASASFNSCNTGSVNYNFSASGEYAAVILPTSFNGTPCNTFNDYYVTLNLPQTQPSIFTNDSIPFCVNDSIVLQCSTTNGTYEWFRNSIAISGANQASLTTNQAGNYSVRFTNSNACTVNSSLISATTQALDNANFSYANFTVCEGSANSIPTNAVNGYYTSSSSNLVFADSLTGEINMAQSADGIYTITHHTQGACPNTSVASFTISALPVATFSYPSYVVCNSIASVPVILSSGASVGLFSSDANLSVNAQTGELQTSASSLGSHQVIHTVAANGVCPQVSDTVSVFIGGTYLSLPNYPVLCTYTPPFNLTANISGGIFSGIGINGNTFNPGLVLDSSVVSYTFTDTNSCTNTVARTIYVDAVPDLSFGNYQAVCQNAGIVNLNNGQPTGGVYTGIGITNNQFNPALGTIGSNISNYIYTTSQGCSDTVTGSLTVKAIPQITFDPIGPFCDTTSVIELNSVTPAGGQFSGAGVTGSIFNANQAGLGTHTLTYTVTANGCTAGENQDVTVEFCGGLEENAWEVKLYPNPAREEVKVEVSKELHLYVYSLEGKLLLKSNLQPFKVFELNIQLLEAGTYLFEFSDEKTSHVERLIIE